jgi:hypothetical protein
VIQLTEYAGAIFSTRHVNQMLLCETQTL